MPTPNYSFRLSAQLVSATTVSVGNVVIPSNSITDRWVVATTANRGTRSSEAIALTAYGGSSTGSIQLQSAGTIDASISGLSAGSKQLVRCSATGTIERVASYSAGDDIIGYAEADGRVHLHFGLPWAEIEALAGGGATPGGSTGSAQANDGAGGFTGYATVLVGNGYYSIGPDASTEGGYRTSYGATYGVYSRNSSDDDNVNLISLLDGTGAFGLSSDLVQVGDGGYNIMLVPGVGRTLHVWSDDGKINDGNGSEVASWNSYGFQFGKTTPDFGMGQGVIGLQNTLLAPSTNPTDGIIIYAEGNVLKYRTPAGTVVALSGSSSVLTLPQINDTSSDHQYVFAVSELAADRTVTLPLLTGDDTFVFQAHTQTLTNKTLTSPTIGGTPIVTATTTTANGNSKVTITDAIANVQTTNATETNLYTFSIPDEAVTCVDVLCTAVQSTAAAGASYKRTITFISDGGTVTVVGSLRDNQTDEDSSAWDFTVDNSFSTCRVIVTGEAATTIQWGAAIRIQTTVP
jgi:hypothetical protein